MTNLEEKRRGRKRSRFFGFSFFHPKSIHDLLSIQVQCRKLVDVTVWSRTFNLQLHIRNHSNLLFFRIALFHLLLDERNRVSHLQVCFSINVSGLHIAYSIGITTIQNNAISGNGLIFRNNQNITNFYIFGWDGNNFTIFDNMNKLVICFLNITFPIRTNFVCFSTSQVVS